MDDYRPADAKPRSMFRDHRNGKPLRPCRMCGVPCQPSYGDSGCCSTECKNDLARDGRK